MSNVHERLNHPQSTARTAAAKRSSYVTMTADDDELILQMHLFYLPTAEEGFRGDTHGISCLDLGQ